LERLQAAAPQEYFLAYGLKQEPVHPECCDGRPAGCRETDDTNSIPPEMVGPALSARVK
jgi:hypothetical protein